MSRQFTTPNPLTAFGDLRTAELTPILQGSFEYTVDNTELNTNTIVGAATVTQSNGMAVVASAAVKATSALFETKRHAKYRAGLGGLLRFTTLFSSPLALAEQYAGMMDKVGTAVSFENGLAVGYNGETFGFHRFSNDTQTTVAQSAWDDPLDGTGSSGMTLDYTKLNVWAINFQYLGAGAIDLYIEDDSTGKFVLVHRILYANLNAEPSTYNPNYHFSLWASNIDAALDVQVSIKCASYAYFTEGKTAHFELHQPQQSTGERQKTAVTTEVALFTIKNKTTYASKSNFVDVILEAAAVSIEAGAANNLGKIRLVKNATLGGTPSYSDINTNNSVVEIDVAGTTVTGGTELFTIPLAGKNDKELVDLTPYEIILGEGETVTAAGSSSNSATINGSSLWKELF